MTMITSFNITIIYWGETLDVKFNPPYKQKLTLLAPNDGMYSSKHEGIKVVRWTQINKDVKIKDNTKCKFWMHIYKQVLLEKELF